MDIAYGQLNVYFVLLSHLLAKVFRNLFPLYPAAVVFQCGGG